MSFTFWILTLVCVVGMCVNAVHGYAARAWLFLLGVLVFAMCAASVTP